MSRLVTIFLDDVEAQVEVSDEVKEGWNNNSPINQQDKCDVAKQLEPMMKITSYMINKIKDLSPSETEMDFGIKISGAGGVFCFAKASAEAQFNVKMIWKNKKEG